MGVVDCVSHDKHGSGPDDYACTGDDQHDEALPEGVVMVEGVGAEGSLAGLRHDNPKLDTLLVDSMTSMCAMMMGWGIMILATAWSGLRRGWPWAFWALLLSGLVALVYYFVISADDARQGASWADGLISILEFSVPLFLGIIAGVIAFRRGLHVEVSRA
jgi:hypothetical protein